MKNAGKSNLGLLKYALAGIAALIAVSALALIAYGGYRFISYGQAATERAALSASRVIISAPAHGGTLMQGQPTLVEVSSSGPEPFERTELWLNGELVGVQEDEGQDYLNWRTSFHWNPTQPGLYQLVARSYSGEQATSSTGTLVQVEAADFSDEAAQDVPIGAASPSVLPGVSTGGTGGPPEIAPPDSEAEGWSLSPGLWLQGLSVNQGPSAPTIQAEVEGCQVSLFVDDQAENESGFLVRRQPVGGMAPEEVASLAPNSGVGSFSFDHMSEPGTFSYSVRAFNAEGTSDSNPAIAEVDPADCAPESKTEFGGETLQVHLENFQTNLPTERNYCYRSFDGSNWTRWPLVGFFNGNNDSTTESTFKFFMDELEDQGNGSDPELYLECWGWAGNELTFLGAASHLLGEEGTATMTDGLLTVNIVQTLGDAIDGYRFYPLSGHDDLGLPGSPSDFISAYYSLRMPRPLALPSYDPDACRDRLPGPLQNSAGKLFACFPFPGFNVGPGGDNPQPYLLWFPGNSCAKGQGNPPCLSYDQWLEIADKVGFDVLDLTDLTRMETFESPHWFVYNIKPYACEGTRTFKVRMWAQMDGETIYGDFGNAVSIPCPLPNQGVSEVVVTFDKLRIMDASDGDFGQDDVEVYGYFKVYSSIDSFELWLGQQSDWPSECPSEAFDPILTDDSGTLGLGCRESLYNGTYEIEALGTCEAPCPSNWYGGPNNNRRTILVADGDKLDYLHGLTDYDSASGNDTVCFWSGKGGSKNYQEWQEYESSIWHGGLFEFENGNCEVLVQYNGANNPPGPQ